MNWHVFEVRVSKEYCEYYGPFNDDELRIVQQHPDYKTKLAPPHRDNQMRVHIVNESEILNKQAACFKYGDSDYEYNRCYYLCREVEEREWGREVHITGVFQSKASFYRFMANKYDVENTEMIECYRFPYLDCGNFK